MHKGINTTMDEGQTMVAHSLRADGFDASEDGTGRGTPLVPVTVGALACNTGPNGHDAGNFASNQGVDAGYVVPVSFGGQMSTPMWDFDLSQTLQAKNPQAVAFAQNQRDEVRMMEVAGALAAEPGAKQQTYTLAIRGREGGHDLEYRTDGTANALLTPNGGRAGMGVGAIAQDWAVRRLTPVECERLQGFPDDYTQIPWRGKNGSPDGPRYKALGNSMACNVMRWIGRRIEMVSTVSSQERP